MLFLSLCGFAFPCNGIDAAKVDFAKQVLPILEERCLGCHGSEKQKGDLRLDSKNAILIGGQSGKPTVDATTSEIVRRILLPPDHDEVMPATAKKTGSLKSDEQELIVRWVAEGADFGSWNDGGSAPSSRQMTTVIEPAVRPSNAPAETRAYFFASTEETGEELWTTDGTESGTKMLSDFYPGKESGGKRAWPTKNGVMAQSLHEDGELRLIHYRVSDDSAVELQPGGKPLLVDKATPMSGQVVLFVHQGENPGIWLSDGTPEGTEEIGLKKIKEHLGEGSLDQIDFRFDEISGEAVIAARARNSTVDHYFRCLPDQRTLVPVLETVEQFVRNEFWLSSMGLFCDGWSVTGPSGAWAEGKGLLFQAPGIVGKTMASVDYDADFRNGACEIGGALYFSGSYLQRSQSGEKVYPKYGFELCVSDGTSAGTKMIADIVKTPGDRAGSQPGCFFAFGDKVLFIADDGEHNSEPWVYDGKTAQLLKDTDLSEFGNCGIHRFVRFGDAVYFAGGGGEQRGLWKTDGTPEGTILVYPSPITDLVNAGSSLLFVSGRHLWTSDGTQSGTKVIKAIDIRRTGTPEGALLVVDSGQ